MEISATTTTPKVFILECRSLPSSSINNSDFKNRLTNTAKVVFGGKLTELVDGEGGRQTTRLETFIGSVDEVLQNPIVNHNTANSILASLQLTDPCLSLQLPILQNIVSEVQKKAEIEQGKPHSFVTYRV
jgi:hypothetical protein